MEIIIKNKNLLALFLVVFIAVLSESCTLWKANDWNAYRVVIQVLDEYGQPVSPVNILTSARHDKKVDRKGRVTLYFSQTGLHIITVQATGMYTRQIKIKMAEDVNKIIVVALRSKQKANIL